MHLRTAITSAAVALLGIATVLSAGTAGAVEVGVEVEPAAGVAQSAACVVPDVAGIDGETQAAALLAEAGCTLGQVRRIRSAHERGGVIGIDPPVGTALESGAAVVVTISDGRCVVQRSVRGLTALAIRARLRSSGCRIGRVTTAYSNAVRKGHVIAVGVRRGAILAHGAKLSVVLSMGPRPIPFASDFAEARRFAASRRGRVAWAVIDSEGALHHFDGHRRFRTASVVKAMILVARLRQYPDRELATAVRSDLAAMIRVSDNGAASRQYHSVCADRLTALARRAGMDDLTAPDHCNWGTVHFSAIDQARFFHQVDQLMPERHRAYGMSLLRSVTGSQRWGIAAATAQVGRAWKIAFKGGWLPRSCGSIEHQAAQLVRGDRRWSLAVLTECNPSAAYGRDTQYGVARRLLT